LAKLENTDADIELLQSRLAVLTSETNDLAAALSTKRKAAAKKLEKALAAQLHQLNMPKAECKVEITPQKRQTNGDDKIEFYLTPNVGEHTISLRESASGGELSRIMLALQVLLAGKEQIPTIVFDEIDANIGGETAVIVGQKLKEIAAKHQVLCITHFPQVARQADHHLRIYKQEVEGRTFTCIEALNEAAHEHELARMHGTTIS
jgi:DNA repair protein RecN (Recombination protein N)